MWLTGIDTLYGTLFTTLAEQFPFGHVHTYMQCCKFEQREEEYF